MGAVPCGCQQLDDAQTADEFTRDALLVCGEQNRIKWRCPSRPHDDDELDREAQTTATLIEGLVKAKRGTIKTCPRFCASSSDAHRAMRLYRATQSGGVNFDDDPPAVLLHAVDTIAGADAARQEREMQDAKNKQ